MKEKDNKFFFDVKKVTSIYQKILLNYMQMISIVYSMDLKWPFYLRSYLGGYANIGGASGQALSFDCLLNYYNVDMNKLYASTLIVIVFPLILIVVASSILLVFFFISQKNQIRRLFSVIIIISVFFQSSINQKLFQNLTCKRIDEKNCLAAALTINCDSGDHKNWVKIFLRIIFY